MSSILGQLPLAVYPLSLGLIATSSLAFGNVGLGVAGPLPIIRDQLGPSALSARAKVRVWNLFFASAGVSDGGLRVSPS